MNAFWDFGDELGDTPALIVPDQPPVSYEMLNALAEDWKNRLLELAAGRRPIVVLEFFTSVAAIAAYLGALRAGLPILAVEPGQMGAESALRQRWQPEIHVVEQNGALVALEQAPPAAAAEPHVDLRLLLSTSGSTGDPKLVRLSGRNIDSNARSIAKYLGITASDRAMTTLPLFYSYGLSVLNSYLAARASLVLTERSVVEPAFWAEFNDLGATSLALVPHQFDLLERSGFSSRDLPRLRYMTQAGGKLPPDTVRRFHAMSSAAGWDLVLMYGQTEAAPRISYVPPTALPQAADTIGQAIPGGRLWLADEVGKEITRPGVPGELIYEGPNVMMGYAESRQDLSRGEEVDELRTGDIAELTPDGLFRIVGRQKRFVKLFGLRLSLDQIEAFLREKNIPSHAVSVGDQLVILHENADQGTEARAAVATEYELPLAAVHAGHLAKLPLLASGKTDQRTLHFIATGVLAAEEDRPLEHGGTIAEALMTATRSRSVGPKDSFTSLGGDSLSYLQMQMALELRLGRAPDGWENMSLTQLEAMTPIDMQHGQRSPVGIEVILRLVAICLVVAQHASNYPLYGGVWVLIAIMGFSAARFQLPLIVEGKALRFGWRMLYPILPLYLLLLLIYAFFRKDVPQSSWLLYGNYELWSKGSLLTVYWFVSLYVQIVFILMIVALVPTIRRRVAKAPWGTVALIMPALLLIEASLTLPPGMIGDGNIALQPLMHHPTRGLVECLPIFALGWMIQRMNGVGQTIATLALSVLTLLLFGYISDGQGSVVFLAVTIVALAANPKILMPKILSQRLQQLASVTLFVYLLHEAVVFILQKLDMSQLLTISIAIPTSFAAAIIAKASFDFVDHTFQRSITGLRARIGPFFEGAAFPRSRSSR